MAREIIIAAKIEKKGLIINEILLKNSTQFNSGNVKFPRFYSDAETVHNDIVTIITVPFAMVGMHVQTKRLQIMSKNNRFSKFQKF